MLSSASRHGGSTASAVLRKHAVRSTALRATMATSSPAKKGPSEMPPASPEPPLPNRGAETEKTEMPWNGWFSSFLKDKMGAESYDRLRRLMLWAPDDVHNLEGIPRPNTKVVISKDGKQTAQFRYPSPGSRRAPRIPGDDPGSDPYFIAHYVRDTRRRGEDRALPHPELEKVKIGVLPDGDPRVEDAKERLEKGPGSSPGNKGMFATGKTDYDPKGLRATMSTNWEAMNEELDKWEPNHLPTAIWEKDEDEIIAKWEALGLPVPPGRFDFGTVPRSRRILKWGSDFAGGIEPEKVPA